MTRPFTGHRKCGMAAVMSVLTFAGSGSCVAGVTTAAVGAAGAGLIGSAHGDGTWAAELSAAVLVAAGFASAVFGAATGATDACGPTTPGMTMWSPTFTIV